MSQSTTQTQTQEPPTQSSPIQTQTETDPVLGVCDYHFLEVDRLSINRVKKYPIIDSITII